jgi:hypothetical protein
MRKVAANRPSARAQADDPKSTSAEATGSIRGIEGNSKIRADLVKYPGSAR